MSLKAFINKVLLSLAFLPCTAMAQPPLWVNEVARTALYPVEEYYCGFSERAIRVGEDSSSILEEIKQAAKYSLSESIMMRVSGNTKMTSSSETILTGKLDAEVIKESFSQEMKSSTSTVITNASISTYLDNEKKRAYAIAIVKKQELEYFYGNKVEAAINKARSFKIIAATETDNAHYDLARNNLEGAKKQLRSAEKYANMVYMVNPKGRKPSDYIEINTLLEDIEGMLAAMDKGPSIYVVYSYKSSPQDPLEGGPENFLPELEQGLSDAKFRITEDQNHAVYVLMVTTSSSLRSKPTSGNGFISYYANANVKMINRATGKELTTFSIYKDPKVYAVGSTETAAAAKAFNKKELYSTIVNNILKSIKQ